MSDTDKLLTCQIMVRMPSDLYEALKRAAAAQERPLAQLVRHVLRMYVQRTASDWVDVTDVAHGATYTFDHDHKAFDPARAGATEGPE